MNSESPLFTIDSMLYLRHAQIGKDSYSDFVGSEFFAAGEEQTRLGAADLAVCIQNMSLENSQSKLLRELSRFMRRAEPLLPNIEDAVDSLKELFLFVLRDRLSEAGINLDARLVLGIDAHGMMKVMDEEHQTLPELEKVFADAPGLGQALREIARQTLLLRGVQEIENALVDTPENAERYETAYRVCLKGALSHFYFTAG